jgi:REP element-mobilizing transposase RayT
MSRPPRVDATEYLGHRSYFLTICCDRKRSVFVRPEIVDLVLQRFLQAADARRFSLSAYCFMPDHFHALAAGLCEDSNLSAFASLAKQRSAYYFKRAYYCRLWQEGYFDRVLRSDEPEMTVIRYVVSNPVRAGLVQTPQEYPFWGSQIYSRDEILEAIRMDSTRRRP